MRAREQFTRLGIAQGIGRLDLYPLRACEIGRRNDAGAIGEFEEPMLIDLEAEPRGLAAIEPRDGEHLAANAEAKIRAPFDVLGDGRQ
jgi:hypothetical protein